MSELASLVTEPHYQCANEAVPLDHRLLFCFILVLIAPKVYSERPETGECFLHMLSENVPIVSFLGHYSICTCVSIKHQWQLCTDPLARCVSHCTGGLFWPNHTAVQLQRTPSKCVANQAAFCRVSAGTNYWCPMLLHECSDVLITTCCLSHKPNSIVSPYVFIMDL